MDGVMVTMTEEQTADLIARYAPSWHVCATGPYAPGTFDPIYIRVDGVVRETREEAEEHFWACVESWCATWKIEYDPSEWQLGCLCLLNGN